MKRVRARANRPLLFLETVQLGSPDRTGGLPALVVLHHILVRSSIPLPHVLHGWQEAEYVRWVDEHSPQEAWSLVESTLVHWEKKERDRNGEKGEGDDDDGREYVGLARTVLRYAKGER